MKPGSRRWIGTAAACALIALARGAFALGADYPNDRPVTASTNWPKGMDTLVNHTNRVHGFFVNAEDVFFYAGTASELTAFLRQYARIEGIVSRRLILHDGVGEAKSPWGKTGRPCDWKLYACPKGWHNLATLPNRATNSVAVLRTAANEPGYVVEVHFWTGGHIALDKVDIPKTVEVRKGK